MSKTLADLYAPGGPPSLTIGIEFEFLFGGPAELIKSSYEDLFEDLRTVCRILQRAVGDTFNIKFAMRNYGDEDEEAFVNWTIDREAISCRDAGVHLQSYGREDEIWSSGSGELITPILRLEEMDTWMPILLAIQRCLATEPGEDVIFTAWTNEICGLHVHIAQSRAEPLSQLTVQHIIAIYGIFEDEIDLLHPTHRRINTWCRSLKHNMDVFDTQQDFLDRVYGCADLVELARFLTPESEWQDFLNYNGVDFSARNSRINILGLVPPETFEEFFDAKPTVEFRQKAGTLDMEDVRWWVVLLSRIVQFAQELENERLIFGIEGEVDLEDLLEMVEVALPR